MRAGLALGSTLALLAGCGRETPTSPAATASAAAKDVARPDLARCEQFTREEGDPELQRKAALALPASFKPLAASDMDHIAVVTQGGATLCLDTRYMEAIAGAKATDDQRFLAFDWTGYEAFGHVVIDRTGAGQVLETGNPPLAAATAKRFAAIDLSESGFGGLNAFAVWDIEADGLRELAKVTEGIPPGDWRIEDWSGDVCVNLSVLPIEQQPAEAADFARATRDPWHAADDDGWKPAAGHCPG